MASYKSFKPEFMKENISQRKPLEKPKVKQSNLGKFVLYALLIFFVAPITFLIISTIFTDNETTKSSKNEIKRYKDKDLKYSKANLNIRKHPNTKGKVLKVIKPNDKLITYDSIVSGFVMVLDDTGKEYGWASSKYLQKTPLSEKQFSNIKKKGEKQLIEKEEKQAKANLKFNPLGIDKKVVKDLEYNTVPFDKWEEWGNPKTLEGTNNTYWVVLLPKSNISFVAKKKSNFIVFADFGKEKAINYLKNRLKKNKAKVKKQFSSWNGSHRNLTSYIKRNMHDDSSYEHVETVYWVYDDYIIVKTTFRGTNTYGGKVLNSVKAKISFDGAILEIL